MRILAGLAATGLVACERPPTVFADVLPDDRLILNEAELIARGVSDDPSDWATWLYEQARATNLRHSELIVLVEAVTVLPASYRDRGSTDAAVWGPWIVDSSAERLWVEHADADRYTWAIERQRVDPEHPRFDDDAWITDLSGHIDTDSGQARGGAFVIDVDEVGFGVVAAALEAFGEEVAPAVDAGPVGRAALTYTLSGQGGRLTTHGDLGDTDVVPDEGGVTFEHASGEGGTATATLSGDRNGDGVGETTQVWVQWSAGGGGRADVEITEGGTTRRSTECWGPDHGRTWRDGEVTQGDPGACLFEALP